MTRAYKRRRLLFVLTALVFSQTSFANQKESYKELISKSQNLSLQHDRLQACQILVRALQKETKNSNAYREIKASLEELSIVFYTDQAQALFSQADSLVDTKIKDAIDKYQEALKLEEGNMAILEGLARAQLRNDDCSGAENSLTSAEAYNPLAAEYSLLRLQTLQCKKDFEAIVEALAAKNSDLDIAEKFIKVFVVEESFQKKDFKKARQTLSAWESQAPEYPEIYFWKWQISSAQGLPDKVSAQKYVQLCKGLTARRRKTLNLDVDLCKNTEDVETKLKALKQ